MRIAIDQPYFFPYIGYWQLINCADEFVILDDVSFIKKGFINRNYILLNGEKHRFTIPVQKASQNRLIRDTQLAFSSEDKEKLLHTFRCAYAKAPEFTDVFPLLCDIVRNDEDNLTQYVKYSIECILEYLKIEKKIYVSSKLSHDRLLKGQERIIGICKERQADEYVNPCGGRSIYDKDLFLQHGLNLRFLDTRLSEVTYRQFGNPFVPNLSIVDILMFNDVNQTRKLLEEYDLNE